MAVKMVTQLCRRIFIFTLAVVAVACTATPIQRGSAQNGSSFSTPEQIIVDSDGAVFWDDGASVAMLLKHPEKVRILGISMVIGNHWPYQGAEYMARVLKAGGASDIPIYIGADKPLKNSKANLLKIESELMRQGVIETSGFWKGAYSRAKEVRTLNDLVPLEGESLSGIHPQTKRAIDFIIETLNGAKEPVTFVAIGPLTNLAEAIQRNPSIVSKIRRLLIMGGNLHVKGNTTPYAELNFLFDPEAAQFVMASGISEKLLFPLDLSNQAMITQERYRELVSSESPFATMLKADRGPKFKDPSYSIPSWDTTVAAFLIDPTYITESQDYSLSVVTKSGPRYGSVEIAPEKSNAVKVMTKMDFEKFFSILKEGLERR
jgi:inosine-uridine nucleoside N-ribohydrolase